MTDYRLLVTASRDWTEPLKMWETLTQVWDRVTQDVNGQTLVIVHGDAPGGDQIAKLFAQVHPHCREEGHPANWGGPCRPGRCKEGHRREGRDGASYCPAAGMYRNEEKIVGPGGDFGIAFINGRSPGASGCAKLMREHGIRMMKVMQ